MVRRLLVALAGATLLGIVPLVALARQQVALDAVTVRTRLSGTDAYVSVPTDFDLLHADGASLARYGFPPRPDPQRAPHAYAAWKQAVIDMQRIEPVLQPVPMQHSPLLAGVFVNATSATSSNWSGYVSPAPAFSFGSNSMVSVHGDWMVPVAQTAFNGCFPHTNGNAVYSSTWVGIDGSGSYDVVQAGTESDAVCSNGVVGPYQGAWYEWFPSDEVRITNLAITPGSAIYVHVWAQNATRSHVYVANKTTRQSVSLAFDAPPNTQLVGNSAEWIVERPVVNGLLANLTNYVQELFVEAGAKDGQGNLYTPGPGQPVGQPPALQIKMTDQNNQVISVPTLIGQHGIWFTDQGSARHIPKNAAPS